MAGCGNDLTRQADSCQKLAALVEAQRDVIMQRDRGIVIFGFHILSKIRERRRLGLHHDQLCALLLGFLGQPGMVGMVMGCQGIGDVFETQVVTLQGMQHLGQHARPADIHQQPGARCADHIEIGRTIPHVEDLGGRHFIPARLSGAGTIHSAHAEPSRPG